MQQTVQNPIAPSRYGLGLEPADLACGTFWGNAGRILDYFSYAMASPDGRRVATIEGMAETDRSLKEQLDEIGAQLDWVRDYL